MALEREVAGAHRHYYNAASDADVLHQLAGKSAFFEFMRYALFVASDGRRDVARCAALISSPYQEAKREAVGFIGYFAAAPDCKQHVQALLERAETWLTERGVTRIIAPYNGSMFLGDIVLRTDAFEEAPCYPMAWHPPFYADYLQGGGFAPAYPMLSYEVDLTSPTFLAFADRALLESRANVRPLDKRRWNCDLETFRVLLNETFQDEWEHCPISSKEFHEALDPVKPLLDSRQVLFAEVDGELAGMCCGLPDWAPLFRSLNGKLGTIEKIRLLLGARSYRRAGAIIIGVLPEFRGAGVAQALAAALYGRYVERGLGTALYHVVNVDNHASRRFAESMGGRGRVLYHGYAKHLS